MKFKAITYCYRQNSFIESRVVGIFTEEELVSALNDIRNMHKSIKEKIVRDTYDQINYFIEIDNSEKSYYYTSDYTLNELNL